MPRCPVLSFLVAAVVLGMAHQQAGAAETIRLEAEDFVASHDVGGIRIYARSCTAASQGLAVDGLDMEGEWMELRLELASPTAFLHGLQTAGDVGLTRTFAVDFRPQSDQGTSLTDTLTTIPGSGIG
jgi:hypothetical protein